MKKQNEGNKRNKRNKKSRNIGKKILIFILIILIVAIGWFVYKTQKNGGGLSGMLATAVGHDEYTKKNLGELKVLILGVSTDIDAELTDTIMIASYDPNTQKANLLSIPRDTFVGKNQRKATASQKINALYNINRNPQSSLDAINELTGLDIKYYAVVRTEGLIELVDAIGGVEFNVPIDMVYDDTSQDLHINLKAGTQVLDGDKAEQLLRWRHSNEDSRGNMSTYPQEYGNDDFGRMRTQRDFIGATLKQTLRLGNIFKIGQLLEIAHKNIETNIDLSYLKDYIPYVVEFNTENLTSATLPGTTPNLSETNGVSIFVMDKTEGKNLIDSMFNKIDVLDNVVEDVDNSKIKIELLNGCNDKDKLEKAKQQLQEAGFNVVKVGTTMTMAKTVITNKKNVNEDKLKEIKEIIGTGDITTNKSGISTVDATIIIGEDF